MGDLRAYALGIADLRGVVGATGARAEHVRTLAQRAYTPRTRPLGVRDMLGPIYRRVPGRPVLWMDEPAPDDLDTLLAGRPVPPARATATWRLLESVVAGLAWSATGMPDVELPAGLLLPTGLPVPPVHGLTEGWCPLGQARTVPELDVWLGGAAAWGRQAERLGRPSPDVVVLGLR